MEITYGNTSFCCVSHFYIVQSVYGKVYVGQLFKLMQVMQCILTKVMHYISIKVIQKLVN